MLRSLLRNFGYGTGEMVEILIIIWGICILGFLFVLIYNGYCAILRSKNKRKYKRIEILYRVGMAESANILHLPLIRYRGSRLK